MTIKHTWPAQQGQIAQTSKPLPGKTPAPFKKPTPETPFSPTL